VNHFKTKYTANLDAKQEMAMALLQPAEFEERKLKFTTYLLASIEYDSTPAHSVFNILVVGVATLSTIHYILYIS